MKKDLFVTEGVTQSERSLHTPGSFAKQNLLYVQEVGTLKSLKPHRCVREGVDSFLFLVVLSGKGSVEVQGHVYQLTEGDCALLNCMEHYEHISDETDGWELAWVHFNGHGAKAYNDLFERYQKGSRVFRAADKGWYESLLRVLLEKQQNRELTGELESGVLLLELVNHVLTECMGSQERDREAERRWAAETREFLNENYADRAVLDALAERLGESMESADERFRGFFGIGLQEYVDNRRLNAAKELLRFTIKPVEEISADTGLGEVEVMQRIFRNQENMTAEEYRMKWAQWIK